MAEPLLPINMNDSQKEQMDDEFRSYDSYLLRWMFLYRSSWRWNFIFVLVFLVFGIFIPAFSYNYISCKSCDTELSHPFKTIIEFSLSLLATISFIWISYLLIDRVLSLDSLVDDTHLVRHKYIQHLNKSLKIRLPCYILPFFVAKCAYKIWWYSGGASENPFLGNMIILNNIVACSLELTSWLYRTTIFFFACIIFSNVHYLQKLRVDDFNKFFQAHSDSKRMLKDYFRMFDYMSSINNCSSLFIVYSFAIILAFQVYGLEYTDKLFRQDTSTIFIQVDLALCSLTIVMGLKIMFNSIVDTSIMMKGITSAASRWHANQTVSIADGSMSFEERQALVNCFAQNTCGVVIFGVKVEAVWLRLINFTALPPTFYFFFVLMRNQFH